MSNSANRLSVYSVASSIAAIAPLIQAGPEAEISTKMLKRQNRDSSDALKAPTADAKFKLKRMDQAVRKAVAETANNSKYHQAAMDEKIISEWKRLLDRQFTAHKDPVILAPVAASIPSRGPLQSVSEDTNLPTAKISVPENAKPPSTNKALFWKRKQNDDKVNEEATNSSHVSGKDAGNKQAPSGTESPPSNVSKQASPKISDINEHQATKSPDKSSRRKSLASLHFIKRRSPYSAPLSGFAEETERSQQPTSQIGTTVHENAGSVSGVSDSSLASPINIPAQSKDETKEANAEQPSRLNSPSNRLSQLTPAVAKPIKERGDSRLLSSEPSPIASPGKQSRSRTRSVAESSGSQGKKSENPENPDNPDNAEVTENATQEQKKVAKSPSTELLSKKHLIPSRLRKFFVRM